MKLQRLTTPLLMAAALWTGAAQAQTAASVAVDGAWARASVPGQKATGAFMRLTAPEATRLVRVESAAAGVSEVHEMKMDGDVMKMRAITGLDLPAGQAVELKPGSYHVMLMDLKAPLPKGASVPLTLIFQDAKGMQSQQQLQVPVVTQPPGAPAGHPAPMHKQH
ncbi:MAG: copper chaperone PCu(A)C [Simplicispira sp.]|nr:copper chaperone PCu(A)C [Simplicispira sp.]